MQRKFDFEINILAFQSNFWDKCQYFETKNPNFYIQSKHFDLSGSPLLRHRRFPSGHYLQWVHRLTEGANAMIIISKWLPPYSEVRKFLFVSQCSFITMSREAVSSVKVRKRKAGGFPSNVVLYCWNLSQLLPLKYQK